MKNLNLDLMGVHEMNTLEMQCTDGGFVLIIVTICAVAAILPTCCRWEDLSPPIMIDINSVLNENNNSGNTNSIDLAQRYNMPIGY
ncbi:MAG: hypothetical protein IPH69_15595 [Bacteroidales bacterium]|nr:hypothetical protein [Bacteroidales bacterium]